MDELRFDQPKTKEMARVVGNLAGANGRALVVTADTDRNVALSARNIPGVGSTRAATCRFTKCFGTERS